MMNEFEIAADAAGLNTRKCSDGSYFYQDTQAAYCVWQAVKADSAQGAEPVPNSTTVKAMEELESGKGTRFSNEQALFDDLYLQPAQQWLPSEIEYDRAIHHNPDAKAWADLFMQTFPHCGADPEMMHGWFANAMMAMYDHLNNQQSGQVPCDAGHIADDSEMVASDNREAFELFAQSESPHIKLTRKGDTGEYLYKTAHFAWSAWQAARAQGDAEPEAFAVYWGNGEVELHEAPMPALGDEPEDVTPLYTRPPKGQAMPEWVKYSERLPGQLNREYLVRVNSQIHSRPRMFVAEYNEYGFDRSKVTHWMPLPSCPTPQEDSGDA